MMRKYILILLVAFLLIPAVSQADNNAREYYLNGTRHLENSYYLKAEVELRHALTLNPYYQEAYVALGRLYNEVGRYEAATNSCSMAVNIDPFSIAGYFEMGRAYFQLEDDSSAYAQFRKVLELNPVHQDARLYVARLEHRQGSYLQALRALSDLDELYPNSAPVFFEQGLIFKKQGEPVLARNALRRALDLDPSNLRFALEYADFLLETGEVAAAALVYQRILMIDAQHENAILGSSRCAFYLEQPLSSELQQALRNLDNSRSSYFIAYAAARRGDTTTAVGYLEDTLDKQENDNIARILLAELLQKYYRVDNRSRQRLAAWHLVKARHYEAGGDNLLTRYHYECAIIINPQDARTRYEYGRYLDRVGFSEMALRHLNAALELDPFSDLYKDYYSRVRYNQVRSLTARMQVNVMASKPARVALFLHYQPLGDVRHPGLVEILSRKLTLILEQSPKFTVVYTHPFEAELEVEEAEARALREQADVVVFLDINEEELKGELEGTFITVTDGYRAYDLHLRSRGNLWSDIIGRQLALALDHTVPARGEVVEVNERDVLINLGAIHSLQVGDRVRVGARAIELKLVEVDEQLSRCTPLEPEEIELLKRHDAVVSVPAS